MAIQKQLLKTFSGLHTGVDLFDVRPADSPLLLDCYSDPKNSLSSPKGSEKYFTTAKSAAIYGLYDFKAKSFQQIILSIANGTMENT